MNRIKRLLSILLLSALLAGLCSCSAIDEGLKKTRKAAGEECKKVAEEYFEALAEGDYDKCEELSLYKEDYDSIGDFSTLEYLGSDYELANSSDSYNGYYLSIRYKFQGIEASDLFYFSYQRSERKWKINAVDDKRYTVTELIPEMINRKNNG